jgi:hypothetical protein
MIVSFSCHKYDLVVCAVDFGFDGVVGFLDGFFGLFGRMSDKLGLLKCPGHGSIAFHEGQIGTFGEFQFARICCHIIRALTVH